MRAGFDVITQGAQLLDARPDGGATDSETLRQFGAGNGAGTSGTQRVEDFHIEVHVSSKSSPMSTARAECVMAPTEMKSTPASATPRMVASVIPPLASVCPRPLHF